MTSVDYYDYAIDPNGNSTPNKILRWVGHDKRVLELGTAAGVMTRALKERGCTVTGVEFEPAWAARAESYCERMIVADLEQLDFAGTFSDERFDVLVAADVLEHLRDPWQVLESARALLAPDGHAVFSIPHVGHAAVIAGLVDGRFDYRDKGLLDRTHLRFFTRSGVNDMLLATGWLPIAWESHRVPPLDSEFASHWLSLQPEVREQILRQPDSDIYQFIVKAVPATESGWQQALIERVDMLEQRLQSQRQQHERLLETYERTDADLREHQKAFGEAREWIDKLLSEKQGLQDELTEAAARMDEVRQELRAVQVELQRVHGNKLCGRLKRLWRRLKD